MDWITSVGRIGRYYDEVNIAAPGESVSEGESFEEIYQEIAASTDNGAEVVSAGEYAVETLSGERPAEAISNESYQEEAVSADNGTEAVSETISREAAVPSDCNGLDAIFEEAAANYNLPVELLKALAKVESNFNPTAVSSAGAMGVMQLMPNTAKGLGVTDPFDARQNIMGGAQYLRNQLNRFGDLRMALAAYNTGPGNVVKYGGVPSYTERYVNKVLSGMGESTSAYESLGNYYADYTPLASMGLGSYYGALGGYDSLSSYYSALGSLGSLNSLGSLGSLGYYSSLGSMGMLGSYGGLSGYGLLNSYSSLNGMNLLSGGTNYNLLLALSSILSNGSTSASGDGDTITMDRESFSSLIELMRIQMMMNTERQVGSFSLI